MYIIIGKYKLDLLVLVLCVIIFWILFGHLFCSCCRGSVYETLQPIKEGLENAIHDDMKKNINSTIKKSSVSGSSSTGGLLGRTTTSPPPPPPQITSSLKSTPSLVSKTSGNSVAKKAVKVDAVKTKKEGFNNMGGGGFFVETPAKFPQMSINPDTWNLPNYKNAIDTLGKYKNTSIPLKNTMFMFKDTEFKPECCQSSPYYSNSVGCACMNLGTAKYLWSRGGNNVPYSEY